MTTRACHTVRPPAFAGTFYPAGAGELRRDVIFHLANAGPCAACGTPKALILPHAGYVYSGAVAAAGYRCLEAQRGAIRRVILLGPSHRLAFTGVALSAHFGFATPLGVVAVDEAACAALLELPQVNMLEQAHAHEHSLEVHLPFLQVVLADFQLVPLVVGAASAAVVSAVIEQLWGGVETRIIVSSDLSHYHDYVLARRLDATTAASIEQLQPLTSAQACGAMPVNGLLDAARRHRLIPQTLDLRNSGDTAGERERVVGYGAFGFCEKV